MVNKYLLWSVVFVMVVNSLLFLQRLDADLLARKVKPLEVGLAKSRQSHAEKTDREVLDGHTVSPERNESVTIKSSPASDFMDGSAAPVDPFDPTTCRKVDYGTPSDTRSVGAAPVDPFDPATWPVADYGDHTDTIPVGSAPIHPFDPSTWRAAEGALLMPEDEVVAASVPVDPFDPDTWGSREGIPQSLEATEPSAPIDPFDPLTW